MKSFSLVLLVVVGLTVGCGNKSTNQGSNGAQSFQLDAQHIETTLQQFVESGALVGVSALLYIDGEERFMGAYGQADRENNQAMSRDTIIQIYSMTKPVTGVALMTLYEQGKFKLDDPLANYLPEYSDLKVFAGLNETGEPIYEAAQRAPTIYDVLRHTAGFVSSHGGDHPLLAISRKINPDNLNNTISQFSEKLATVPLLFQPGTRWLYGPSVDVQAALVEKLSSMKFHDYVEQKLFLPLKMNNTQWRVSKRQMEKLSAMYTRKQDGSFERINDASAYENFIKDWPLKKGGSGLTSTLDDYMRFARMLVNGGELDGARILKAETLRLMTTDALPAAVTDRSWLPSKGEVGFGIDFAVRIAEPASKEEASGEVGEYFWDGAANTLFWVDPTNKLTAVLFTQFLPYGGVPLHKAFRDAVYLHDESASALNKPALETAQQN